MRPIGATRTTLRTWVALVDDNRHQIDQITAQAAARGVTITILLDIVHVLEYLWAAAWCFFDEGEVAAEKWVAHQTRRILQGHALPVATAIARKARAADRQQRTKADACITYLRNNAAYLNYPTALASGWPIATGIIEGACRHLVADRLDITGTRWSLTGLTGAEAILKLRALTANGDLEALLDPPPRRRTPPRPPLPLRPQHHPPSRMINPHPVPAKELHPDQSASGT